MAGSHPSHITAEAVAQPFLSGWISRFGVPSTIVTDRGQQFESQLWNTLMTLLGSKQARTTSYHPQTNGMAECFHRQLKAALKAQPQPDSWMDALPFVLLGIRTTLKEDVHISNGCRDGIRHNSPSPWRIFHPLSNISA